MCAPIEIWLGLIPSLCRSGHQFDASNLGVKEHCLDWADLDPLANISDTPNKRGEIALLDAANSRVELDHYELMEELTKIGIVERRFRKRLQNRRRYRLRVLADESLSRTSKRQETEMA
jgi:hypothetical protein